MTVLKIYGNGHVAFFCPGCRRVHALNVVDSLTRPHWTLKGGLDNPTITPSFVETSGHFVTGQKQPPHCYLCNDAKSDGRESFCGRCHLYVTAGRLHFLADCTHKLAGQTVPMIPVESWPQ